MKRMTTERFIELHEKAIDLEYEKRREIEEKGLEVFKIEEQIQIQNEQINKHKKIIAYLKKDNKKLKKELKNLKELKLF